MPITGNPNSCHAVFTPDRKRRRTQDTPFPRRPGPPPPPRRGPPDKPIDLTKDDAELVSYSSTAADDSEDSLNLGAAERSKARIAGDGRATRRLKAGQRSGESSKVVNPDSEMEPIEEFLPQPKRGGRVKSMVQNIERNGAHPPKLQLFTENPLNSLSVSRKLKVRLFTEGEGRLADTRVTRQSPTLPPSSRYLHMGRKARGKSYLAYPSQTGCEARNASGDRASIS